MTISRPIRIGRPSAERRREGFFGGFRIDLGIRQQHPGVAQLLRNTTDGGGGNRQPFRHRLRDRERHPLEVRRQDERIGRTENRGNVVALPEERDCVLQPAGIVHNELDCSDDVEVLEIYSPAVHETRVVNETPAVAGSAH